jgi:ComF family protein
VNHPQPIRLAVTRAVDALLAITLAPRCAACASALDEPSRGCVCADCWGAVRLLGRPLCPSCGDPLSASAGEPSDRCALCRHRAGVVDGGRAAGEYEGALRRIVHAFKYDGHRSLAAPLGMLMRRAGAELLDDAHLVVPVPLHPWRRFTRGFNQAADLAAQLRVPMLHALRRTRATATQAGLTAAARRRNVRRAFQVSPLLLPRAREALLTDRVLVLVDDVRTTGATLDACARVLKDAGAREVRVLTAARAAPPSSS